MSTVNKLKIQNNVYDLNDARLPQTTSSDAGKVVGVNNNGDLSLIGGGGILVINYDWVEYMEGEDIQWVIAGSFSPNISVEDVENSVVIFHGVGDMFEHSRGELNWNNNLVTYVFKYGDLSGTEIYYYNENEKVYCSTDDVIYGFYTLDDTMGEINAFDFTVNKLVCVALF